MSSLALMSMSLNRIVRLNVGGRIFSTTHETLSWIPETFFTSLLSGRIPSIRDDTGAYFIDRDPEIFQIILNYLRNRHVSIFMDILIVYLINVLQISNAVDPSILKCEAEYYGLEPLIKQLNFCNRSEEASPCCGGILFHCFIAPPAEVKDRNMPVSGPVHLLAGNNHWIVAAIDCSVVCYRYKETLGWYRVWTSPPHDSRITSLAINSRYQPPGPAAASQRLIGVAVSNVVHIYSFIEDGSDSRELQSMSLDTPVSSLFFMGTHLVALSFDSGCVALWHGLAQQWQMQRLPKLSSCDKTTAGLLLLGSTNGIIYCIDLQKFPVRMRDNDVLVVKLFEDPLQEAITSLSVYVPASRNSVPVSDNWLEVAYGTEKGTVRVIVQHPEYFSQSPTLFLTFTVHMSAVVAVRLSDKNLMSVCSSKHVRTWSVNRFRGMLSTQPGSSAIGSFDLAHYCNKKCNECPTQTALTPFGHQDDEQLLLHQLICGTDSISVKNAATGNTICNVKSVDGSSVTSVLPLYWESQLRMATSSRFLFTGHASGSIQMWNLSTALDQSTQRSNSLTNGQITAQDCIQAINELPPST